MKFKPPYWEIVLFIFANEKYKSIARNFKILSKIWLFIMVTTTIIDILTMLYLKNMAFAIIFSLSGFTFAYLTIFILFTVEKTIKKHVKI